jgi:hypothetical protein
MPTKYVPKLKKEPTKQDHKFCTKCNIEKPFTDFKVGPGRFGLHSWCIICVSTYQIASHIQRYQKRPKRPKKEYVPKPKKERIAKPKPSPRPISEPKKLGRPRKAPAIVVPTIPEGCKKCRKCKKIKEVNIDNFQCDVRAKGGFHSRCKECTREKYHAQKILVAFDKRSNAGRIASGLPPWSKMPKVTHRSCKTCLKPTPVEELRHPSGKLAYKNCLSCREARAKMLSERDSRSRDRIALENAGLKKCCTCKTVKPKTIEYFNRSTYKPSGFKSTCKLCDAEYQVERNRILKESGVEKPKSKPLTEAQKAKGRANRKIWRAKQKLIDPLFKIRKNLSRCIQQALKKMGHRKSSRTSEILGCSMDDFKKHLESLFQPGMTWENYGKGSDKWNIDHHYPQSAAKTKEEVLKLNHYTNLRPMWEPENLDKFDKIPDGWNPLL